MTSFGDFERLLGQPIATFLTVELATLLVSSRIRSTRLSASPIYCLDLVPRKRHRASTPALLAVWGFCTALWDISWCTKGYINTFDLDITLLFLLSAGLLKLQLSCYHCLWLLRVSSEIVMIVKYLYNPAFYGLRYNLSRMHIDWGTERAKAHVQH